MATKAEDLRIIRSFAERLDCRVSPIAAAWEAVKGNSLRTMSDES